MLCFVAPQLARVGSDQCQVERSVVQAGQHPLYQAIAELDAHLLIRLPEPPKRLAERRQRDERIQRNITVDLRDDAHRPN